MVFFSIFIVKQLQRMLSSLDKSEFCINLKDEVT